MRHPIVEQEEELLAEVAVVLQEEPYEPPARMQDIIEELVRLREDLANAKQEDLGSMMAQYDQQHALLRQVQEANERPQVDPDSPYFAHIRLTEEGKTRDVCLGKATKIRGNVRIVDWRHAPVSRIFYRYQEGEEYEEEIGDRVREGIVDIRRTVTIHRGQLERIDAPDGTFRRNPDGWDKTAIAPPRLAGGEGSAFRSHSVGSGQDRRLGTDLAGHRRRQDKRLPDIAGLIDPDQFDLITRPDSGFVVIRGTAGSGKTTVALHRIAYLAYKNPVFNSPATLFLVFSPALKDYVSHVLPSLGVPNVKVQHFREWSRALVKQHFNPLPRAIREDTPAPVVRLKLHPATLLALTRHVETMPGPATRDQALDDVISVTTQPALLRAAFDEVHPDAFTDDELERITRACRDHWDDVIAWTEGDREVDAALDAEDDALLLRAWQLRVGPLRRSKRRGPVRYRHIAIDEVQDFTPTEVQVLMGCLDRNQSITLAGDTQQHVMQEAGFTSWTEFFDHLGVEGTAVDTLRVAYRSSAQIVTFARHLLGELAEDEAPLVTRDGPAVELFRFTDHGASVAFLADALRDLQRAEPLASIAVLTGSTVHSALYYDGLNRGEVPRLRRVLDHEFSFAPGVEVTEIERVKGLEFDYVVLVEVSAHTYPDRPAARRVLHVGATRAVHQLWLVSVGEPSPIVRQAIDAC